MIGQTFRHYLVLERIGAGGMGEVYRAHDQQLDRDVAIKVVAPNIADDPAASQRLLREARAAAALNHPHICTIHEVGEADGRTFIAMELIDGQSLDRLIPVGGVPVDQVVRTGLQIADALAHAHDRGVVHRDLKSANVVVSREGRVKVLDFGLAKRLSIAELTEATTQAAALTQAGAFTGTLPYMAPEQLRGEPADARSDIWALGVVLHELAAGARPFVGRTGFEVTSAILSQSPGPLPDHVPVELRTVIAHCLEKPPERRYQRAGEVHAALEAIQTGLPVPAPARGAHTGRRRWLVSAASLVVAVAAAVIGFDAGGLRERLFGRASTIRLAVLPFENLTGDTAQEYFSDGLTEEMITQLGRLQPQRLAVIARTSAMHYKKTEKPIDQIGRELGVDYVLEGGVRREADRVRITAELIRVRDQTQVWTDSSERELSGILAVQSDVARGVARALALALLPEEQTRLANAVRVDPEAYEAYLRGREHVYRLTATDLDAALQYFELALRKDPNYALAYTGVAAVWSLRQQFGFVPPRAATPNMKAAAARALALDSTLAEVHYRLAITAWNDWDWGATEQEFERAIQLNPNYPDARSTYSHFLNIMKRPAEAMMQIERALELDPLNPTFRAFYGRDLMMVRRYDDALAQFQNVLKAVPNHAMALSGQQEAFYQKQMYAEALEAERSVWAARGDQELVAALDGGRAEGGYAVAMGRAAGVLAARSRAANVAPIRVAQMYLRAGMSAQALEWLERSYEARDPNMPYLGVGAIYDPLRGDPRFQDLLRRMKLPT